MSAHRIRPYSLLTGGCTLLLTTAALAAPASVPGVQPLSALTLAVPTTLADALIQDDIPAAEPDPTSWRDGWVGGVEGGLNGSSGNSDTLNFRLGVFANRITSKTETRTFANYVYSEDDGNRSSNRGELGARNDWMISDSPWSIFAQGLFQIDEFQDWDSRLSGFVGVGYAFVRTDTTLVRGRLGAGGSYTWGGSEDGFTPEGLIGVDFEHQINERQRVFATADIYPSLEDGGEFRSIARAGWEILVDPSINMSLRLGIENRSDSEPGGDAKKNDCEYFALLSFAF